MGRVRFAMPEIQLPFVKSPRSPGVVLAFSCAAVDGRQERLRGRIVLRPVISLGAFRGKAVIDKMIVRFSLTRVTQAAYLHGLLSAIPGAEKIHVEPVALSPHALTTFDLTIQEPSTATVLRVEDYLQTKFGLAVPPAMQLLEVSLDFWADRASPEEKARLIGVLQRCYLPLQDIWSPRTRPRFNAGDAIGGRRFILPETDGPHLSPEKLKVHPVDATYYLGERDSDWMIRLMHKELDDQNPATGARRVLGPEEQRVRMEVVLRGEELRQHGLLQPRDLIGFRFTRLQGNHFRFLLPTIHAPEHPSRETLVGAMETWKDRNQRIEIFLRAGLIGLETERRARRALREENRQQIRSARKRLGVTTRPARQGSGLQANYIAYEELNQVIQRALEGLSKREATEMRRR